MYETGMDATSFWSRVNKNGPKQLHMKTRCWVWTGGLDKDGYGVVTNGPPRLTAHKAGHIFRRGPIPKGKCVLHRCDHRPCVRHTFLGTRADNMRDCRKKGRHNDISMRPQDWADNRGSKCAAAKLLEEEVIQIRNLSAKGMLQKDIASRFGVRQQQVSRILRGERWGHLASNSGPG